MEKIKVVFYDEKIICERENFSYNYLEEDYKKLYQLLEILAKEKEINLKCANLQEDKKRITEMLKENEEIKDCYFIVSKIALEALKDWFIDTSSFLIVGDTVKDDSGKVIGCRSFSRG